MNPRFSIIIVNYNTAAYVEACVSSIRQHSQLTTYEIIVADNSCEKILEERAEGAYRYIWTGRNLGFGMANNLAARYATGEYLVFVNPDVTFTGNVLGRLEEELRVDRDAVVGVNLADVHSKPCISHGNFPSFKTELMECVLLHRHRLFAKHAVCVRMESRKTGPVEVDYVSGALFCMRKQRFDQLGGFSKRIFLYYEDTELMYRHKRDGGRVVFIPEVLATHVDGVSTNGATDFKIENMEIGRAAFYQTRYQDRRHLMLINGIRILHLLLLSAARRRLIYTKSIKHYLAAFRRSHPT